MNDATSEKESGQPRVLLVDDHDLFRTGLAKLLTEQGVHVIGEAASGDAALRLVHELTPEVVVMDLNMPGLTGLEATREITASAPRSRVVVLTISEDDVDIVEAIMAGACGYLLKNSTVQELVAGISAAADGDSLISPRVGTKVLQQLRAQAAGVRRDTAAPRVELSVRELDVLRLIALGKDNAQIAQELYISPKTVKNHISNILMKLQIENRIQAAVYAVRSGIV